MKAIILVGGPATRLRPLTLTKPKALIELQEKTILEHVLDLFKKYEITDIVLSTGYLKEQIRDYFGDGKKFGVNISYVEENEPMGTAGALNLLPEKINETFIVCNGDELKSFDISKMINAHKNNTGYATLALREVDDPTIYGVARLDGEKILEFIEKPKIEDAPSRFINAGFYIFEPEIFYYLPSQKRVMFEYDMFPKIASDGKMFGYKFDGQWFDTGNIERLEIARNEWKGIY